MNKQCLYINNVSLIQLKNLKNSQARSKSYSTTMSFVWVNLLFLHVSGKRYFVCFFKDILKYP